MALLLTKLSTAFFATPRTTYDDGAQARRAWKSRDHLPKKLRATEQRVAIAARDCEVDPTWCWGGRGLRATWTAMRDGNSGDLKAG